MSWFYTKQLLLNAAVQYRQGKQSFSRDQISKKINEIKYLAGQKKVPRISLRKEITHLEYLLQEILELDQVMARQKVQDSAKVTALKRQISQLKHKLTAMNDKELPHKVEKLSYVLGDYLARKDTQKEINVAQKEEIETITPVTVKTMGQTAFLQLDTRRIDALHQRLEALKQELEITQQLGAKNPQKIKMIESKVKLLEKKLSSFLAPAELPESAAVPPGDITHKMIFNPTGKTLKEELLPPPQPVRKK